MRRLALMVVALVLTASAEERVTVLSLPVGATASDAEVDAEGVIHAAYFFADDVYYVRGKVGSATFSEPIRINSEPGTAQAGMFRGPDVALGPDGAVHAIWFTNAYQRKLPKDQWGVHYSKLAADGKSFLPARNLNQKPSDCYSIAADAIGNVAIFWIAEKLFIQISSDGGKTFSAAQVVPGVDPCECCATRAYYAPDGTLYCAYREKSGNLRDMYLLNRKKGAVGFERTRLSEKEWKVFACPMTGSSLGGNGRSLLVGYETSGQSSFARITAGKSAGEISPNAKGVKKFPLALEAGDGVVLLGWKTGTALNWQLFDKNNVPVGAVETLETKSGDRFSGVVSKDGRFYLLK